LANHGAARQRFAREARAAAAVVHEHVVAIHNVESGGVSPFLVMQFVSGESLQARIDRKGPLGLCEVLRIAHQTAAGLTAAHAQGLVHRDVKPANILLEEGVDRALLTDFGLARASDDASLTHTGYMPGTPHYMSCEQAQGESVDHRSDLFSLGSVMYTMCTGRPPFRAETSYGILRRIIDCDPRPIREVNPEIPGWLVSVIAKLHQKDPAARFASAGDLASLLAGCLAHVQQPDVVELPAACLDVYERWRAEQAPETPHPQAEQKHLRSRKVVAMGALFGLVTAAVLGGIVWKTNLDRQAKRDSAVSEITARENPASENPVQGEINSGSSESTASTASPTPGIGWDDVSEELDRLWQYGEETFPLMERRWR
jgi:serine/threonine protein kinase